MLEFNYKDRNKVSAYITLKKQFNITSLTDQLKAVFIYPGVQRGLNQKFETATDSESNWGSHLSLKDIHLMFIAPNRMVVY